MSEVRVRFAPSPTGLMHIGGVRTALFNYLFAKQSKGKFILRLEDTDRERFVPEGIEQIVASLEWLGLVPDEGFWITEGKHQNVDYVQSERHVRGEYEAVAKKLLDEGLAYYSKIPADKYTQLKNADKTKPFVYRREMEADYAEADGDKYPIRLSIEAIKAKLGSAPIVWRDEVRGEFKMDLDLIEDFILIKSDGFPTYNFANIIDDHEMKISHVIRGDEFIASGAKHALLYKVLDWTAPKFVHLPVINGADGKKLSKRTGDTNVLDYKTKGYLPEAIINFLALLGWNPGAGETQEIYAPDELIKRFSLDHVQKSPAVFDVARLDWMNGEYIRALEPEQLLEKLIEYLGNDPLAKELAKDKAYSLAAIALTQDRFKRLEEAQELLGFFFRDPDIKLNFGKLKQDDVKRYLQTTLDQISANPGSFNDYGKELETLMREKVVPAVGLDKPGDLFMAVRIAITGQTATPGLFETMVALGVDTVKRRLEAAIESL